MQLEDELHFICRYVTYTDQRNEMYNKMEYDPRFMEMLFLWK